MARPPDFDFTPAERIGTPSAEDWESEIRLFLFSTENPRETVQRLESILRELPDSFFAPWFHQFLGSVICGLDPAYPWHDAPPEYAAWLARFRQKRRDSKARTGERARQAQQFKARCGRHVATLARWFRFMRAKGLRRTKDELKATFQEQYLGKACCLCVPLTWGLVADAVTNDARANGRTPPGAIADAVIARWHGISVSSMKAYGPAASVHPALPGNIAATLKSIRNATDKLAIRLRLPPRLDDLQH